MNEDTIQFSNMDSWRGGSGKDGLTFKQIVLLHINRCVQNGSVEFRGGYWEERCKGQWSERYYVPNSRDVYNNSVSMLRALLVGYFDKKMNEADKKLKEEYDKIYSEYVKAFDSSKDSTKRNELKGDWYLNKIEWHIRLFEELVMLSKRLNFFEEQSGEEEA